MVLHLELDEFSQLFETTERSSGLIRLRATLGQGGQGVERLLAQRSFIVQRPTASADAAGGVRALTEASDAVIAEIAQWLQQVEGRGRSVGGHAARAPQRPSMGNSLTSPSDITSTARAAKSDPSTASSH